MTCGDRSFGSGSKSTSDGSAGPKPQRRISRSVSLVARATTRYKQFGLMTGFPSNNFGALYAKVRMRRLISLFNCSSPFVVRRRRRYVSGKEKTVTGCSAICRASGFNPTRFGPLASARTRKYRIRCAASLYWARLGLGPCIVPTRS